MIVLSFGSIYLWTRKSSLQLGLLVGGHLASTHIHSRTQVTNEFSQWLFHGW